MNRHVYFRQQKKNELYHHGIKGQKWGIRRYQNPDGTLTAEGRKRYGKFSRLEVKRLDISDKLAGVKNLRDEYYALNDKVYEIKKEELDYKKLNNKGLNDRIDEIDEKGISIFEDISDENFMKKCFPKTNEIMKETAEKETEYKNAVKDSVNDTINLVGNKHLSEIENKYKQSLGYLANLDRTEKENYDANANAFLEILFEGEDLDAYMNAYRSKKNPIEKIAKKTLSTEKLYKIERAIDGRLKDGEKLTEEDKKNIERAEKGADLGLKALNKMKYDGYDEEKGITESDRWWFIYEDQTIGNFAVCDLINQGKTKGQIISLINQAQNATEEQVDSDSVIWELGEFGNRNSSYINKFIDACYDIKKE